MAATTESAPKSRVRSPNFQTSETLKLEELVRLNFDIINSKLTNSVTNKIKSDVWEAIAKQISSLGYASRTKDECQTKWANLKRAAKHSVTSERLEKRKTGGGPCSTSTSEQSERIVDLYKNSASFHGITGGIDSDERGGLHYFNQPEPVCDTISDDQNQIITSQSTMPSTDELTKSCTPSVPKRKSIAISKGTKRSRHEELVDLQIEYFKGQVERQSLEREIMEVKLRLLKKGEIKMDELGAYELLKVINED